MKAVFLALIGVISLCGPASAASPHGAPPDTLKRCPRDSAGYDDGCDQAPAGGQFINPRFFTNSRQSGQRQFKDATGAPSDHPPPWNVAGVDYAIGAYTPDAKLIDAKTNPPRGCTYNSALHYIRCNSGVTIEGYRFDDVGVYSPGANTAYIFRNNHITMGKDVCRGRAFTGNGILGIGIPGSSTSETVSNTFDLNDECSFVAAYYKQPHDPGLVQQSSGTASLNGKSLTYSSPPTGNVAVGQYIDCAGCTKPARIVSGSGLSWALNVAQSVLGPLTVTTGPIEPTLNGAAPTCVLNGGSVATLKYNAAIGWPTFAGGSCGASVIAKYNYLDIYACCGQHNQFMGYLPSPGANWHLTLVQDFNTIVWNSLAERTGTSTFTTFATGNKPNAPAPNGYQVTYDKSEVNNNTVVSNKVLGKGAAITNSMIRYLNQGPAATANIKFTMTDGVVTVTEFTNGSPIEVGQYISGGITKPIQIKGLGTGTGRTGTYMVSNDVDTISAAKAARTSLYPGKITVFEAKENYFDLTGADTAYTFDTGNVPVGTMTIEGNINMGSGRICNVGAGNCN